MPKTVEEQKAYRRAYYQANKERLNAYHREYVKKNRKQVNDINRKKYQRNKEFYKQYQKKYYRTHPEVTQRHEFKRSLQNKIKEARESLRIHQKENGMDGCDTCIIRQSKIDCLERLYEENFMTKHEGIVIPNCPVVLAKKIIKY